MLRRYGDNLIAICGTLHRRLTPLLASIMRLMFWPMRLLSYLMTLMPLVLVVVMMMMVVGWMLVDLGGWQLPVSAWRCDDDVTFVDGTVIVVVSFLL